MGGQSGAQITGGAIDMLITLVLAVLVLFTTVYIGLATQNFVRQVANDQEIRSNLVITTGIKLTLAALIGGLGLDLIVELFGPFMFVNVSFVLGTFFLVTLFYREKYRNDREA